jgi:hypothetical protein
MTNANAPGASGARRPANGQNIDTSRPNSDSAPDNVNPQNAALKPTARPRRLGVKHDGSKPPPPMPVRAECVPAELKKVPQWVCWDWVWDPKAESGAGKWTKPPRRCDGRPASSTDPGTWATFEQALEAMPQGGGVGFAVTADVPFFGVDLDDCVKDGVISQDARAVIEALDSYTEFSPSGTGIRILAEGKLPPGRRRKGKVEMYETGRYLTITGHRVPDTPTTINERQEAIALVHAKVFSQGQPAKARAARRGEQTQEKAPMSAASSDKLLNRARNARNGAKFRDLYDRGEWQANYTSQSEADAALCDMLAFWTGKDAAAMDRLFRASALMRDKWDERRGDSTYGAREIVRAIERCEDIYSPRANPGGNGQSEGEWLKWRREHKLVPGGDDRYRPTPSGLVYLKPTQNGSVPTTIANFTSRIVAEVILDDGAEVQRSYHLAAFVLGETREFQVPARHFPNVSAWAAEHLGARAVVFPGYNGEAHVRTATQLFSGTPTRRVIYQHTGWREINGTPSYLHAGGAIGPQGVIENLEVGLKGSLFNFRLPPPPVGEELRNAVAAVLSIRRVAPDRLSLPLIAIPFRAVLGVCDVTPFLFGTTGRGKSELAALPQQHFGADFTRTNLPASWSHTPNALRALLFSAKDSLLTIDDFVAKGGRRDQDALQRSAEQVLRGQGNVQGRGRCHSDGTLRADRPPRGMVLVTGEEIPTGLSLRARGLFLEVRAGDVNWNELTRLQGLAKQNEFAKAMAGYIRWLAQENRLALARARIEDKKSEWRGLARDPAHQRTPDSLAQLDAGFSTFIEFAVDTGALPANDADNLRRDSHAALRELSRAQGDLLSQADPCRRLFTLLVSGLSAGRCHIADRETGGPPLIAAQAWGWREHEGPHRQPQGERIGWVDGNAVFLEPETAIRIAQDLSSASGEPMAATVRAMGNQLKEKEFLLAYESNRATVKVTASGARHRVWKVPSSLFTDGEEGHSGQDSADPPNDSGPVRPADQKMAPVSGTPSGADGSTAPKSRRARPEEDGQALSLSSALQATAEPHVPTAPNAPDHGGSDDSAAETAWLESQADAAAEAEFKEHRGSPE